MDSFPDPRELTDQQLVELVDRLSHGDEETDYLRGVAEQKVKILRAELIKRSGRSDDDPG